MGNNNIDNQFWEVVGVFVLIILAGHGITWLCKKIVSYFRGKENSGYITNDFVERIKAMGSTAKHHQKI